MAKPTPNVVDQAVARLGKTGASAYFFDRLENPDWIGPLYDRGFFKRPPGAIRDETAGTISFPDWPEVRYLLRMVPKNAEAVGRIVMSIPDTDNTRVQELLVEIGAHLPRESSAPLADRAASWLENAFLRHHFGQHFAKFIAYLAEQGEVNRSKNLAERLFSSEESSNAMDGWYLERNLKLCLPALQASLGVETIALLQRLLLKQMKSDEHDGRQEQEDYSYIWRRDLTKANHAGSDPKDVFVDAILETSQRLARTQGVGFGPVCNALLAGRRPIFRRLAMYVAADVCNEAHPFVIQTLFDPSVVDRHTCRSEYARLLQAIFPKIDAESQTRLIEFLTTDFLRSIPEESRRLLTDDRATAIAATLELQRLLAFGQVLPEQLIARRDALLHELGEPSTASAVWRGPTSPVDDKQLEQISLSQIIDFLKSWQPAGTFGAPSPEGLGRTLQAATVARALEFSRAADTFINVGPTYVRAVITGLADVIATRQAIEWERVFVLLRWVCDQPIGPQRPERSFPDDADSGWSYTRNAIARLLENGLLHRESGLSVDQREMIWGILEALLADPDPPADEEETLSDSDFLTRSINSVRGLALRSVVRYAWWIHSGVPVTEGSPESFDRYPEVRAALERSLEDLSPAVRCVLGEYFPSLFYLDPIWTTRNVDAIFPEADEAVVFWGATWGTFVEYAQPYDPACDTLRPKYDLALRRLSDAGSAQRKKMGERGLGQHLASYFWRAVDGEKSTDRLLEYFDRCLPELVGHTLWVLGRGLDEVKDAPPTTINRLMDLWSQLRRRSAKWSDQKRRELVRHFGTWFTSEQLDTDWALGELEQCIETGFGLIDVQAILVRLGSLADSRSLPVVRCVELLVREEQQLRYPFMWEGEFASVLKALLSSNDHGVRQRVRRVVDKLVEGGSLFARDLIAAESGRDPV